MNIKSIVSTALNLAGVSKEKLDKKTKTSASDEKDTQLGYGQEEASHHRMSEEEAQEALEYLKELDGIKESSLSVHLSKVEDRYIVFVEDRDGQVIRRIPEQDLWVLYKQRSRNHRKGNLLNKAV